MDARIMQLTQQARIRRSEVDRRKGERDALQQRQAELAGALAAAKEQVETATQAVILLREGADYARRRAGEQVQDLTTSALRSVFGPAYEFRLINGESAGRPVVTCQVVSPYGDQEITTEGTESRGGGIVDIQAMALRIAMLETCRQIDGPLLLDEPAKHVSEDYIPLAGQFLQQACRRFGRQVIMVTHNAHLAALADQTHQVQLVDGASRVA